MGDGVGRVEAVEPVVPDAMPKATLGHRVIVRAGRLDRTTGDSAFYAGIDNDVSGIGLDIVDNRIATARRAACTCAGLL